MLNLVVYRLVLTTVGNRTWNAGSCEGLRHQRGSPARSDRTNSGRPREPIPLDAVSGR